MRAIYILTREENLSLKSRYQAKSVFRKWPIDELWPVMKKWGLAHCHYLNFILKNKCCYKSLIMFIICFHYTIFLFLY